MKCLTRLLIFFSLVWAFVGFPVVAADSADQKSFSLKESSSTKEISASKEQIDRSKAARRLHLNRAEHGALTSRSERLPEDGSFVDRYLLGAEPGTSLVVDLNSEDFDAFLIIQDMAGRWIVHNDDFMTGTDSRVVFQMPTEGDVWVVVNTYRSGETGSYVVRAINADDAEIPAFPSSSRLALGEQIRGSFSSGSDLIWDDTYAASYRIPASESGRFSLVMSSDAFRPYVMVVDAAGNTLESGAAPGQTGELRLVFNTTPGVPAYVLVNQMSRANGDYRLLIENQQVAGMPTGRDPDGNYAFLVGMSYYPPGISDLPLVANDIIAMRQMLAEDLGYDPDYIYVLEDQDATRDNILTGISEFLGRAGENGTAMFYFSGHGTKTQENVALVEPIDIEEDGVDEALVAYDSLIIDDELGFSLRLLGAGHISVFLDTCHSGTGVRTDTAMPKFLKASDTHKMLPNTFLTDEYDITAMLASGHDLSSLDPRIAFFASSRYDELSWIASSVDMSLYTFYLTEMLPQYLGRTMGDLERSMQPLVVNWSRANLGATQTPNAEGRLSGITIGELLGVQR